MGCVQYVVKAYPSDVCGFFKRREHSIPPVEELSEAAPVPDLLGSILSGQSLLLMDSSDVVINRDGSLKAPKPGKFSFYLCFNLLPRKSGVCTLQLLVPP